MYMYISNESQKIAKWKNTLSNAYELYFSANARVSNLIMKTPGASVAGVTTAIASNGVGRAQLTAIIGTPHNMDQINRGRVANGKDLSSYARDIFYSKEATL